MKSTTSLVARQCRLQEWAMQIRECQNRPSDMNVREWCALNGITKDSYYYRLKKVREACLETIDFQGENQEIVEISEKLLYTSHPGCHPSADVGLDICFSGCSVHVSRQTPINLLSDVVKVIINAQ